MLHGHHCTILLLLLYVMTAGVDEAVDAVKRAYQAFDASGKGHVSAHDIFRVMEEQVYSHKEPFLFLRAVLYHFYTFLHTDTAV
jgi:hypothetical protein